MSESTFFPMGVSPAWYAPSEQAETSIERVPPELLLHIFSFLDALPDLYRSRLVCRTWRDVTGHVHINHFFYYLTSRFSHADTYLHHHHAEFAAAFGTPTLSTLINRFTIREAKKESGIHALAKRMPQLLVEYDQTHLIDWRAIEDDADYCDYDYLDLKDFIVLWQSIDEEKCSQNTLYFVSKKTEKIEFTASCDKEEPLTSVCFEDNSFYLILQNGSIFKYSIVENKGESKVKTAMFQVFTTQNFSETPPSEQAEAVEPTLPQSRSFRGGLGKLSTNSFFLDGRESHALQGRVLQVSHTKKRKAENPPEEAPQPPLKKQEMEIVEIPATCNNLCALLVGDRKTLWIYDLESQKVIDKLSLEIQCDSVEIFSDQLFIAFEGEIRNQIAIYRFDGKKYVVEINDLFQGLSKSASAANTSPVTFTFNQDDVKDQLMQGLFRLSLENIKKKWQSYELVNCKILSSDLIAISVHVESSSRYMLTYAVSLKTGRFSKIFEKLVDHGSNVPGPRAQILDYCFLWRHYIVFPGFFIEQKITFYNLYTEQLITKSFNDFAPYKRGKICDVSCVKRQEKEILIVRIHFQDFESMTSGFDFIEIGD